MIRYSLTTNNVDKCSGGCKYCIAAQTAHYSMGVNKDRIIQDCIRIDEQNYAKARFDFNTLEETLNKDPRMKDGEEIFFDLWGADPVTNFLCMQEEVGFIEDWGKMTGHKVRISSSTNGYPLLRDDVCDYIRKHGIAIQISHDGLGQWIRTGDIDPLDFDNVRSLMREGLITAINCTLSFWNWTMWGNIRYFNDKLRQIFPEVWSNDTMASKHLSDVYRRLYIKLNHIMDGDYWTEARNEKGLFNGISYDTLKGLPIGDMSLHNDTSLAQKTGIMKLAHVLDDYIEQWFQFLDLYCHGKTNTLELMPYMRYISSEFKRGENKTDETSGNCRQYQTGFKDYSDHLDTTGRYTQCNLLDADTKVQDPDVGLHSIDCGGCKYRESSECRMCGAVRNRSGWCGFFYRWNQFLDISRNAIGR